MTAPASPGGASGTTKKPATALMNGLIRALLLHRSNPSLSSYRQGKPPGRDAQGHHIKVSTEGRAPYIECRASVERLAVPSRAPGGAVDAVNSKLESSPAP